MRKITSTLFCLFAFLTILTAQPANDECVNAIFLDDVSDWCSNPGEFSTEGATDSNVDNPSCFPQTAQRDIWFAFTARARDVNISITGDTRLNAGGTLNQPQLAIYSGGCGNLQEVQCRSDNTNRGAVQTFVSALNIGETYYIRVSARNLNTGSFKLCINNFNAAANLSSDCATGVVLCDKSPFTVDFIDNFGAVRDEINDVFCVGATGARFAVTEEQSTWFKWTCDDPGSLTFTITPLNPDDDIDWALYELPNGIDDCGGKNLLRYNISGEVVGAPFSEWEACTGATGMREGDEDEGENCGCDPGDNNFSRPIDMGAGRVYALVILNFSQSGAGYTINFGGTGTFLGPRIDFATDINIDLGETACVGKPVRFTDGSTFEGGIIGWEWFFGQNANLSEANTQGPHLISFDRPGVQSVLLQVTSADGCVVSLVKSFEVTCCNDHFALSANVIDADCPGTPTGAIDFQATTNFGIASFAWSNGAQIEDLSNLFPGDYSVQVTDNATCDTTITFTVGEPDPFLVSPVIDMPTCNGGTDGGITLQVSGASAPYEYSWEGGAFSTDDQLSDLSVGDYQVQIRDQNDCLFDTLIEVRELELILDPSVDAITPPTCTGFSDGSIEVTIGNGAGPFEYDWQDGQGFRDDNSLFNLPEGSYAVQVRDRNLCLGFFEFDLRDFDPLRVGFATTEMSCFGRSDGTVTAFGLGGNGPYDFRWSNGQTNNQIRNLPAGDYQLTITDDNGCVFDSIVAIGQPPEILVGEFDITDVRCFGESSGQIIFLGSGGTPPYSYSIGSSAFQTNNLFAGLPAGTYNLLVRDAEGCQASRQVAIDEPLLLSVDAGSDRLIELGEAVDLLATPSSLPVTFRWMPEDPLSCVNCSNPLAIPLETTTFEVVVTDPAGCEAADQVVITVAKNRPVYIPTAFSPNNDGNNDFFTIYAGPSTRIIKTLRIFDRWGNMVYEGLDLPPGEETLGWDGNFRGKPMSSAAFVYVAEIEFIDNRVIVYKGDVALIR